MTTQVSRPMIIALLGTVLFAAVWFVILRPKSATESTSSAPVTQTPTTASPSSSSSSGSGGTSLTERPDQARAAVQSANGQIEANKAQADAAANGTAATPSTASPSSSSSSSAATSSPSTSSSSSSSSAPASSASAPATEQKVVISPDAPAGERAVLQALADDKVVVLLFWDASGAEDKEARRAVRRAVAGRKKVEVATIPASQVGKYEAITGGITIEQTPTTMIIGPSMKAITISGLIDQLEIEQAIAKLRAKS